MSSGAMRSGQQRLESLAPPQLPKAEHAVAFGERPFQKAPIRAGTTWRDHGISSRWPEKVDRSLHPHVKPIGLIAVSVIDVMAVTPFQTKDGAPPMIRRGQRP